MFSRAVRRPRSCSFATASGRATLSVSAYHRGDSELSHGAQHAHGGLSAVGHEQALDHRRFQSPGARAATNDATARRRHEHC